MNENNQILHMKRVQVNAIITSWNIYLLADVAARMKNEPKKSYSCMSSLKSELHIK